MDDVFQVMIYFSYIVLIILLISIIAFALISLIILIVHDKMTKGMCNCDQDMTGKTVLITGANSGIGKETAIDLARRNARVILACRNLEKARNAVEEIVSATGNTNLEVKHLDLTSFDSVRKCAQDVLMTEEKLHVLINNAGIWATDLELTQDGWEKVMQSNHLGHFLLTLLLLGLLKKSSPSRIINVSSILYMISILDTEDMNGAKHNFLMSTFGNLYYRSKLANILFTRELATSLSRTGVTVNAVHPGIVKSGFGENISLFSMGIVVKILKYFFGKNNREGAQTTIYAAVHPDLAKTTGKYFSGCRERRLFGKALNENLAKRLFEVSENIVGMTYQNV